MKWEKSFVGVGFFISFFNEFSIYIEERVNMNVLWFVFNVLGRFLFQQKKNKTKQTYTHTSDTQQLFGSRLTNRHTQKKKEAHEKRIWVVVFFYWCINIGKMIFFLNKHTASATTAKLLNRWPLLSLVQRRRLTCRPVFNLTRLEIVCRMNREKSVLPFTHATAGNAIPGDDISLKMRWWEFRGMKIEFSSYEFLWLLKNSLTLLFNSW